MRINLTVLSLLITLTSVGVDLAGPRSQNLCGLGMCRPDQLLASVDAQGITPESLTTLLDQDAFNPLVWCTYAEALAREGKLTKASEAFDRAVTLGPNMAPVLMRAANFAFAHRERQKTWNLSHRILERTDVFDQILFSYLATRNSFAPELLGLALPATPRAARAWLSWLRTNGSDQAVVQTWAWMGQNGLCDQQSAVEVAWTLWERHSFRAAQQAWIDWLGPNAGGYPSSQELANRSFQSEPAGGPFDWTLDAPASVAVSRNNGLELRFLGTENVSFNHIRQTAVVRPGRYRFSAEVQADELTTDQGPFFHIFDPLNSANFQVETPHVVGSVARTWIRADFSVPPSAQALLIQLERRPSERLDNKISGTLHVYQVSLLPITIDDSTRLVGANFK